MSRSAFEDLLHLKEIFCLQIKSGEAVTSGTASRGQRTPQTPSVQPTPESEALELRVLRSVQFSLLKILSKTLSTLRAFTPDLSQILQVRDIQGGKV